MQERIQQSIRALQADPRVQKAMQFFEEDAGHTLEQQIELVQVPSFSNHEEQRAQYFKKMIEAEGFEASIDEVCNVYTTIPGTGDGPTVMISAHLDTVFPMDTDLTVRRDGDRVCCPGIGDDTRGCAEILSLLRGIRESGVKPVGNLIIGGNVGEEGLGNLRGMRHVFYNENDIDAFLSLDSAGDGICYGGTGSYRYKVTFRGHGGHSFGDFGLPNPVHAMGRAIDLISDVQTPSQPKTTFCVGVVEGGTSVNSIAYECSMLLDMRSDGKEELDALDNEVLGLIRQAVEEENSRWESDKKVVLELEQIGNRPVGNCQTIQSPIIQILTAAFQSVGIQPHYSAAISTDANIAISLGLPAAAISGGGKTGDAHTLTEWYEPVNSHLGPQKCLISLLAIAGLDGATEPLLGKFRK